MADGHAANLQAGEAQRNLYVGPPNNRQIKSIHLWLLLPGAYGLIDANAKWKTQSDKLMSKT